MKKTIAVLAFLFLFVSSFSVIGAMNTVSYGPYTEGYFEYFLEQDPFTTNATENSATITGFFKRNDIPSEIEVPSTAGGSPVNFIGTEAFKATANYPDNFQVTLPDCIMLIEDGAFVPQAGKHIIVISTSDGMTYTYFNNNGTVEKSSARTNPSEEESSTVTESSTAPSEPSSEKTSSSEQTTTAPEDNIILDPNKVYESADHFLVKEDEHGFYIVGYRGTEKEVTVPYSLWGVPVYRIASGALVANSFTQLSIPMNVKVDEGALGSYRVIINCDGENPLIIEPDPGQTVDSGEIDVSKMTSAEEGQEIESLDEAMKEALSKKEKDTKDTKEPLPVFIWILIGFGAVALITGAVVFINKFKTRQK